MSGGAAGLAAEVRASLQQFSAGFPDTDVKVPNWWADTAGHLFYFLVEAPNAHPIGELVAKLELMHWTTLETRAVVAIK